MSTIIPEKWRGRLGLVATVLAVALGAMSEWADVGPEFVRWTGRAAVLLVAISNVLGLSVPSIKAKAAGSVGVLLVAVALMMSAGCPNPYKIAWGTTAGVMKATQSTSKALAAASAAELKAGGDKAAICKRLKTYRDNARPAARNAVGTTYAGIRISQEAGKAPPDVVAGLKLGACALILGLREWGHKLDDQGKVILGFLSPFSGMACDKPTGNALAILAALLPVAADLVKWVIDLVGASSEDLQKEINAWIQAPAADEVDALITAECS